ncbi:acetyl-CoA C-acetyltransferase [Pantoea sp. S61]|uniref:acetyl-CoA C-acetyltransferase n=1 Tax=Pantoea sp. S61 TaxID=2767442 RepID=UPI00190B9440|nr:acetyl-CoA C-acetyltransferase [Pantoea sp. S61]MBK0122580.1 acetyl-CoA C-acetyltransferase [Pantoea sp. S61]MBK0122711.1 acetyl-CoA C-acetyltransferase [Pantoea sp. S61]
MNECVIVAATRTPIGRFHGALSSLTAASLGQQVIAALLKQTALDPALIDEVMMGQVLTAGCGQNPARQAAIAAGVPYSVPASTLNMVCGSGLKAVILAAQAIQSGAADIIIAGGQESMSQSPYLLPDARGGCRLGHSQLMDSVIHDGLWDAFNDYHMGITAENLAEEYGISRADQDAFALQSQQKAVAAQQQGVFRAEITPVTVEQGKGETRVISEDEQPRADSSIERLARLHPAFKKDGSVTAGNASSLNDGAAAVLLMSASRAAALGLPVLARLSGSGIAGVDPAVMGIGPVAASRKALQQAAWTLDQVDLIEANEAFAAQALAVGKALDWQPERVNVNGGAIALGHPIGASGCRILVTLIHALQQRELKRGLATLCVGGGMGVALAVERPD